MVFGGIAFASGVTAVAPPSTQRAAGLAEGATTTVDGASAGEPHAANPINVAIARIRSA